MRLGEWMVDWQSAGRIGVVNLRVMMYAGNGLSLVSYLAGYGLGKQVDLQSTYRCLLWIHPNGRDAVV